MRSQLARSARRTCPRLVAATRHVPAPLPLPLIICRQHLRPGAPRLAPSYISSCPGSRRTFLGGVFKKAPREVKEMDVAPGFEILLKFRATEAEDERPPPVDELVKAFTDFFRHKCKTREPVNSLQAFCALCVFRRRDVRRALDYKAIHQAQRALLRIPRGDETENHLELSRAIYKEFLVRREPNRHGETFRPYVTALAQYGAEAEAVEELFSYSKSRGLQAPDLRVWMAVLRAVAAEGEGDQQLLLDTLAKMKEVGIKYGTLAQEIVTGYFVARGNGKGAWEHFENGDRLAARPATYLELLKLERARPEWREKVSEVFQDLCASPTPPRDLWDVILRWAVCSRRQGIDEIKNLVRTLAKDDETYPDVHTLNSLLRAAADLQDPLMAERFLNAFQIEFEVAPVATTFVLQIDYRLNSRDFTGAREAFERLMYRVADGEDGFGREHADAEADAEAGVDAALGDEIQEAEPEREWHDASDEFDAVRDLVKTVANKYLRTLCTLREPGHRDKLLHALSLIEEQQIMLEPDSVKALCVNFLENDQQHELMDTLSLHTLHFSIKEREMVREALVRYTVATSKSTARVWDAYSLLRQFFPETDRASRVRIMDSFFRGRRRPDMAVHVFGHMRAHSNPEIRPDLDVYVEALMALAQSYIRWGRHAADAFSDSLRTLHNMLRMDVTITPNTRLYNALMIAYTAVGDAPTAFEFWREIQASPAGPTYSSLAAVFWASQSMAFHHDRHREIWAKLMRLDVEVPPSVAAAYCGAVGADGNLVAVKELLQGMSATLGYSPDISMLRNTYNAVPGQPLRDEFEEWAKGEYPVQWEELVAKFPRKLDALRGLQFEDLKEDLVP